MREVIRERIMISPDEYERQLARMRTLREEGDELQEKVEATLRRPTPPEPAELSALHQEVEAHRRALEKASTRIDNVLAGEKTLSFVWGSICGFACAVALVWTR